MIKPGDGARAGFQLLEQALDAIMQHVTFVRADLRDSIAVKCEPGLLRFADHPQKRAVGEAASAITTADIGMHAGKPDLLHVDIGIGLPKRGHEGLPALVNGHRMAGVADDVADLRVVETMPPDVIQQIEEGEVVGNAERTDSVPDTDEMDGRGLGRQAPHGGVVEGQVCSGEDRTWLSTAILVIDPVDGIPGVFGGIGPRQVGQTAA